MAKDVAVDDDVAVAVADGCWMRFARAAVDDVTVELAAGCFMCVADVDVDDVTVDNALVLKTLFAVAVAAENADAVAEAILTLPSASPSAYPSSQYSGST